MIMGAPFPAKMWGSLVPILDREYKVIIFDKTAVGFTDSPDCPYAFNMMADDTADPGGTSCT